MDDIQRNKEIYNQKAINLSKCYYIPTIKFRSLITQLSNDLTSQCGFSIFSICLALANGQKHILSNDLEGNTIPCLLQGLSRADSIFFLDHYDNLEVHPLCRTNYDDGKH